MIDQQQLIQELGVSRFDEAEQQEILERYTYAVGAALSDGLDETLVDEYSAIIDGDQAVIDRWLAENAPDYHEDALYKEFAIGYDEDPEKVPADKVYASVAWLRKNRPDFEQTVNRIKDEFRQALATA